MPHGYCPMVCPCWRCPVASGMPGQLFGLILASHTRGGEGGPCPPLAHHGRARSGSRTSPMRPRPGCRPCRGHRGEEVRADQTVAGLAGLRRRSGTSTAVWTAATLNASPSIATSPTAPTGSPNAKLPASLESAVHECFSCAAPTGSRSSSTTGGTTTVGRRSRSWRTPARRDACSE
jgi:hypothetical protein